MPINPSIAMGVKPIEFQDPLVAYGRVAQLQHAQQQNALAQMQMAEYERSRKEEEGVRNYLRGADVNTPQGQTGLLQYGKTGVGMMKTLQESQAAQLKSKMDTLKYHGDLATQSAQILGTATDQASWDAAKAKLTALGGDPTKLPPVYDAAFVKGEQNAALSVKDQIERMLPKFKLQDIGGQVVQIQDNPNLPGYGQPVKDGVIAKTQTPGEIERNKIAQQQLGVSQGQLDVARNRLAQENKGVTYQQDASGNIIALPSRLGAGAVPTATVVTGADGAPIKGKLSANAEKAQESRRQLTKDLDSTISELANITEEGGLIDQSTGSGAGRLVDIGAGFFGSATPGAIAIGKLQPIADTALKMVPRFEGPQSDADTRSYKEAAGQLANASLPTEIRKAAGKTVMRLMQKRKDQFTVHGMETEKAPAAKAGEWKDL